MTMKAHPLHMIVIHFPSALLVMDTVFAGAGAYSQNEKIAYAAYYCLIAGVIGGWTAIFTGMYDLFKYLMRPEHSGMRMGLMHAGVQSFVVLGFTIILSLEYNHSAYILHAPTGLWIGKGLLLAGMGVGNYLGGELLLKHIVKET
jgi:uncharacterized membrane protein